MSALFVKPLPFTISAVTSEIATAPATNANLDEPGMVWRSNGLSTVYLLIDLGASAGQWDTVAIVGSNLRATDTVTISSGTTSAGTGSYSGGALAAFSGTKPSAFTTKSIYQTGTRSERYIRLDFSAPSHPDGFVQAQRIVIGKSILSPGVDYTAEHTLIDPTSISSTLGIDIIDAIALARPRWKFSMNYVDAGSWRNDWVNLLAACGKVWPLLMVVDTTSPATCQTDAVFGRIRNDATAKAIGNTIRSVDLTIDALAP